MLKNSTHQGQHFGKHTQQISGAFLEARLPASHTDDVRLS